MTNEEVERAIDFVLRSQANSEARIEQTNEQLNRLTERVDRVMEGLGELRVQMEALADTQVEFMQVATRTFDAQAHINESLRAGQTRAAESEARINESLRAGIGELAARQSKTEEALARLADAQAQSERSLNSLTKIVEEERGRR
jgi:prefoldin subunit 5